jgi:hypothetical protein
VEAMAYSTIDDVQALIKWLIFTASSKVTSADVTNIHIPEADAYIDSRIASVYVTPITDATDLKVLKFISERIAACNIAKILVLQTSGDLPEIVKTWCDDAETRLNEIVTKTITLPNTTPQDSTRGLYSFTAHGSADNDYDDVDPLWCLDKEQW